MTGAHSLHEGTAVALFDGCERCDYIAKNLAHLDDFSLELLASGATGLYTKEISRSEFSGNDLQAINTLRLMARIVFASGISEEVAR